jgi:glycosyltransferase involved in cell wall biosynthesis
VKVLHVAPSIGRAYGGPTESLIGYIVAAQTGGIEVSVAAPKCADDEAEAFASRAGDAAFHLFPSFGKGAFAVSPALLVWLGDAARSYDVVHVHGLFNTISSLAARSCIRRQIPVIIRPFGTLSRYTFFHRRTALKRAYLALLERQNIRQASAIHFTTATERDNAEWHGIPFEGRGYVIPPPVPRGGTILRGGDWGAPYPSALFLGRIEPVKNIEALLDAWPRVLSAIPNARLTIAGAGSVPYVRSLVARAETLGVARTVSFSGFADAALKGQLLESASIFVLPSHHENFGIAVIEALGASLPVVISRNVQLATFVETNRLGIVSDTEPAPLAAAIIRCFGDRQLHERVRTDAPAALAANFSPEGVGQLLSQMYQAAIRSDDQPADG